MPEIIFAWTVSMETLAGEEPAVVHSGCGEDRDMYLGLKKGNEEYLGSSASMRRISSQ